MPYVITQPCIGHKDGSCYDVCPVDAISPRPDSADSEQFAQLYINPVECIDCGACEAVCPHEAIFHEDDLPLAWVAYTAVNADFFRRR